MGDSQTPDIYQFLVKIDPFDKLPEEVVSEIADATQITQLKQGETLTLSALCQKPFLYIIQSGAIEQRLPSGQLRSRLGAEDQFGFTFFTPLKNVEDGYQAYAIEETVLYQIPFVQVRHVIKKYPEFSGYFSSAAERLNNAVGNIIHKKEEKGLFSRRVIEIASENIVIADVNESIQTVAQKMAGAGEFEALHNRSSCAVIRREQKIVGIVTDRDMTRSVVSQGIDINLPICEVMTKNPQLIEAEDKVFQAISVMLQYNIRCLPVVRGQEVLGLLTTSHLVHNHKTQALFLIEKIKYASSVEALAVLKEERQVIFETLVESGVSGEVQGKVMSMIMDAFNRRLIQLAEEVLGPPPCEYAWMVAGSHARNEVHMLSDQDSAIILSDDAKPEDMLYFKHLAMRVCRDLDACGYPLCDGKFMAATPKWCQPLSVWKEYYRSWVESPEYSRLLNISVFLEVRSIHGKADLVDEVNQTLHECIQNSSSFLHALTRDAVDTQPPLGIFNNLVLEKGGKNSNTLNIKKYALNLIIDLARIYSLAAGGSMTGTQERFNYAAENGSLSAESCKNVIGAYQFLTQVRFHHQLQAMKNGEIPNNNINPSQFSSFERK
ncbi:MAG: DUF294 nucleotidyltransferase-like domain-containing protein, partial [Vibrio sp.]